MNIINFFFTLSMRFTNTHVNNAKYSLNLMKGKSTMALFYLSYHYHPTIGIFVLPQCFILKLVLVIPHTMIALSSPVETR